GRRVRHLRGAVPEHPAHGDAVLAQRHFQRPVPGLDRARAAGVVGHGGRQPERVRGRAVPRTAPPPHGPGRAGPLREGVHGRGLGRAAQARTGCAQGRHRRRHGLQLHRPADARPQRVHDPDGGRARRARAARADAAVVRALRGLPAAAGRGGARHHGRRHDGPRLDPVRAAGHGVRAAGRDREPALQVRRRPARGVARGGLLGERRARSPLPARPHGHQLPARARGLLLRLSDQAARVPGALPRVVPARRREPGGDDPAGRRADAAFGGAVKKDIALYGRVLRYLGPYGGLIVAAVAATLGFALTDAFSLVMLIPFLNALFGDAPLNVGGGQDALEWVLNHTVGYWIRPDAEPQQVLLSVILFILAVVLLKNVFDFFQAYLVVRLEQGVTRDLRNQVYGHLLDLDLRFFGRTRTGQIISRLTSDADQLRSMVTRNIAKLATSVFQVVATLAALIAISFELT